ncbi:MAG: glycosyltransferase family 1 protein [Thermoanaerobaculia bacterium]|nr:glycosyltransferase family 1 protein [Thermoanaerobaculia bacterium]
MSPARPTVGVDLRALVRRPSGIGWYTLALLTRLARRGAARYLGLSHRPTVADDRLREAGVALECETAPLGSWWQQLVTPPRLAAGDVDLFWSPLSVLPALLPVPGVVTVHDLTPLLFPESHSLKVRLSMAPLLRRTVRTAARVVADSRATAGDLAARYPACRGRLTVIYPGVDPEFRPAPAAEIAAVRTELGLPEGYLLSTATLEPRKNLGRLLDAWEELAAGDAGFPPLVLCGGYGWRSRRLLERIRGLEGRGLAWLGHLPRERLVRVFQGALAFVYPSLYEGFGLPVAEAMACGLPTLASNRSSLPEVLGDAGILFDPEDRRELSVALRRVVSDAALRAELGERARERSRRFDWDDSARRMEEVFAAVLG